MLEILWKKSDVLDLFSNCVTLQNPFWFFPIMFTLTNDLND